MFRNSRSKKINNKTKFIVEKMRNDILNLEEENKKLREQLQLEKDKFLSVNPENTKIEYQSLIEDISMLRDKYEEELKKLKLLKSSYKSSINEDKKRNR